MHGEHGDRTCDLRDATAEMRLLKLEEDVAQLKRAQFASPGGGRKPDAAPEPSPATGSEAFARTPSEPFARTQSEAFTRTQSDGFARTTSDGFARVDSADAPPHDALYALRRAAPHLSPGFSCSERDAVLLANAIRTGAGAHGAESWDERFAALEAERRVLQGRFDRKAQECEDLKESVEEQKEKVRATRQEAQASMSMLSQRREEVRKQLLTEESRTQKLQVRNRQLEIELERLKGMLHSQMRM